MALTLAQHYPRFDKERFIAVIKEIKND